MDNTSDTKLNPNGESTHAPQERVRDKEALDFGHEGDDAPAPADDVTEEIADDSLSDEIVTTDEPAAAGADPGDTGAATAERPPLDHEPPGLDNTIRSDSHRGGRPDMHGRSGSRPGRDRRSQRPPEPHREKAVKNEILV